MIFLYSRCKGVCISIFGDLAKGDAHESDLKKILKLISTANDNNIRYESD
jgi:hypothetical protein